MSKDTITRRKGSTPAASLATARQVLNVTPTNGDHAAAQQLVALYNNKNTPSMIKHLLNNLFWDACQFYGVTIPANYPAKWRGYWPLLCAKLRFTEHLPTHINYTWQPTEEEETELDAADALQAQADALFDARMIDPIGETLNELINQTGCNVLDQREIFRTAWPLMLDTLRKLNAPTEGSAGDA